MLDAQLASRRRIRRCVAYSGPELLRGTEAPGAQLKAQIAWLRVFVEGVVIVGSILDPVLEPSPGPWTERRGRLGPDDGRGFWAMIYKDES